MFAGLSESLTLTIVLLLVFGSVCLYLYTRISQTEQKISLIESILLDLKMASDLRHVSGGMMSEEEAEETAWNQVGRKNDFATAAVVTGANAEAEAEAQAEDDFSDVLHSAHSANDSLPPVTLKEDDEELPPAVVPAAAQPVEPNVVLAAAELATEADTTMQSAPVENSDIPFESLDGVSQLQLQSQSQQPNLESLTAKELHGLAKQRGLAGESKMTRTQLIEALRPVV
jgi:hypothetical protein